MQATSLDLVDTEYSACSVSACPNDRSLVACGLYQIVKDETAEINEDSPATKRLGRSEVCRVEAAAILDMAWSNETGINRLAYADATGQICLYDYTADSLQHRQMVQVGEPSRLCLSLDWDNVLTRRAGSLVVSVSDGSVAILAGEANLSVTESWHAHDFEPWIAAYDYWDTNNIWTGGDDCKLKLWDARAGFTAPIAVNKSFRAGVTTLQSHPFRENVIAVGSYDANVRIFDRRQLRTALSETDVGGGVWRLRWHPTDPSRLLSACMHDGFKTLTVSDAGTECTVHTRFDAHGKDSLAYGVDWCQPKAEGQDFIASCSFYDHQLRSWVA